MTSRTYSVKGMHCASCAAIITKKLSKVEGIAEVSVNLATERAKLEFDGSALSAEAVNDVIGKYGYTFSAEEMEERGNALSLKAEKEIELQAQLSKVRFALPVALLVFIVMMWIPVQCFSLLSRTCRFRWSCSIFSPWLLPPIWCSG